MATDCSTKGAKSDSLIPAPRRVPLLAVTFDAVGTLIEPREPVGQTYAWVARRHGFSVDPDLLERRFRKLYRSASPLCFPGTPETRLLDAERQWWRKIVRGVFAELPQPIVDDVFSELFHFYGTGRAWRVYSDVIPTLAELERRGVRRCIVSNFDGRLLRICAEAGLASFFDAIVISSRAGAAKPSPQIFFQALASLAVRPDEALHIGDSWLEDVLGARAAGMWALWIDRGQPPASGRIDRLQTVLDCL